MFVETGTGIPLPHQPRRGGMLGSWMRCETRNMSPLRGSQAGGCVFHGLLHTCHPSGVQKITELIIETHKVWCYADTNFMENFKEPFFFEL